MVVVKLIAVATKVGLVRHPQEIQNPDVSTGLTYRPSKQMTHGSVVGILKKP